VPEWLRRPVAISTLGLLVLIIGSALFAPVLAPHDPVAQELTQANQPPALLGGSWTYPLGTDDVGRDELSRLLFGARLSLLIGIVGATISAILGTSLGLFAGYFEGPSGALILRVADIQFALPFVVIAIAVIAIFGGGLQNLLILLSLWGWALFARTIATSVTQAKHQEYVAAATVIGCRATRILGRHILPNVWSPSLILWSAAASQLILAESALSFIGLGVRSPDFSWGSMLAASQPLLRSAWWAALSPGLAITLTVITFNLLGDQLRDALNPVPARADLS
jgi:peptide/nickel transport system permease protein